MDQQKDKTKQLAISGRLLARNALLNFVGQAASLVVGVVTIPIIIHGLGTERFGLLSLAWVILSYFSIFDLGLGRATTKYVAEALGKGEEEQMPRIVWTTVVVQIILCLNNVEELLMQLDGNLFLWGKGRREEAIKMISDVLAAEPKVLFAYAYGSFPEDRPFHDIDVGAYLALSEKAEANFFALDLAMKRESVLKASLPEKIPPVDVRVLNWAPPSFAYRVIRGHLLCS